MCNANVIILTLTTVWAASVEDEHVVKSSSQNIYCGAEKLLLNVFSNQGRNFGGGAILVWNMKEWALFSLADYLIVCHIIYAVDQPKPIAHANTKLITKECYVQNTEQRNMW